MSDIVIPITKKTRAKSLYVSATIDGVEIRVPDPRVTARRVAAKLRTKLLRQMRQGRDADGTQHTPMQSTLMRRRRDARPPRKRRTRRFEDRFGTGGPSRGGDVAYLSSGLMTRSMSIRGRRTPSRFSGRVDLALHRDRWYVPQVLRRMIIGVTDADVAWAVDEIMKKAIKVERTPGSS